MPGSEVRRHGGETCTAWAEQSGTSIVDTPAGAPASNRRTRLKAWPSGDLLMRFKGRILDIDQEIADRWAKSTLLGDPVVYFVEVRSQPEPSRSQH
jgi:hypothetical protein